MDKERRPDPAAMQRAFTRLASLLGEPEARQQFYEDPDAFLESNDVRGVPAAAVAALASLTPEELEVYARVQDKLAGVPSGVPGGSEVCIVF